MKIEETKKKKVYNWTLNVNIVPTTIDRQFINRFLHKDLMEVECQWVRYYLKFVKRYYKVSYKYKNVFFVKIIYLIDVVCRFRVNIL